MATRKQVAIVTFDKTTPIEFEGDTFQQTWDRIWGMVAAIRPLQIQRLQLEYNKLTDGFKLTPTILSKVEPIKINLNDEVTITLSVRG
jgi:hypothetical protein